MRYCKLLIIFVLTISTLGYSQLPNPDMENWTNDGTFDNPDGWDTSNRNFFGIVSFNPVHKETGAFHGSYCAKLETIEAQNGGNTVTVSGILTLGIFDVNLSDQTAVIKGGMPYTGKPDRLRGYYKYNPVGADSCGFLVDVKKWNSAQSKSDVIGHGQFVSGATSTWTLFEFPITYTSSATPDTINVVFSSSDTATLNIGSVLWVDSIAFVGGTSAVNEVIAESEFHVFPNPASNLIHVSYTGKASWHLELVDILGNVILQKEVRQNVADLHLKEYTPGVYFVRIHEGEKMITRKILLTADGMD